MTNPTGYLSFAVYYSNTSYILYVFWSPFHSWKFKDLRNFFELNLWTKYSYRIELKFDAFREKRKIIDLKALERKKRRNELTKKLVAIYQT